MDIAQPASLVVPGAEDASRRWQAKTLGRIAFAATALFTAQLYLSPAQWFPVLEPLHHALILSALGLGALIAHRLVTNKPLWMGARTAALAVYAGAAVLSPIWTIAPVETLPAALEVAKHFLFFLAVVNTATTPGRIRTALLLFAAAAMVPGFGTFDNWLHDELLVEGFRGRWLGVMADPNHDAMALVAAVPLLLFFAVGRGHGLAKRAIGVVGAVGCLMGIIATHSRGGSVGLAVAAVIFALMSRRKGLALLLVLIAGAGVALLAPRSFWERNQTIAAYETDLSVEGRMTAWQVAGRIFEDRPLLGVGEAGFLAAWEHYAPIDSDRLFGHRYVAHNLFLEVLGELGLVGLLGLCTMIACSLWSAWRARNGELGGEARALFASLAGYLVCQQFSGYSLSWFLYALCAFATCCDAWSARRGPEVVA